MRVAPIRQLCSGSACNPCRIRQLGSHEDLVCGYRKFFVQRVVIEIGQKIQPYKILPRTSLPMAVVVSCVSEVLDDAFQIYGFEKRCRRWESNPHGE